MDFLFQDDGSEIIRRELMRPVPSISRSLELEASPSLFHLEPKDPYVKMAQVSYCSGPSNNDTCVATDGQEGNNGPGSDNFNNGRAGSGLGLEPEHEFEEPTEDEGDQTIKGTSCEVEQNAEAEVDALAEEIADEIRTRHNDIQNPNNVEMGAFILRIQNANGSFQTVRVNRLTTGRTGAVSLDGMYAQAQREFPGIDASNIVGAAHLHPSGPVGSPPQFDTDGNLSDLDFGNLMPSHPNTMVSPRNDWEALSRFVQSRGRSDTSGLSHYILGPDGILREFDYIDGHPAENGQVQERIDSAEDDAAGVCS